MDEEFQALVIKGKKTQQEADSMIQLANEVQYTIIQRKLQPGRLAQQVSLLLFNLPSSCQNIL